MKNKIFKIAFAAWIVLWLWFAVRELFIKETILDYAKLVSMSLGGKRSYVTGGHLYEFITFSDKKLPKDASYRLVGLEDGDLKKRRAIYYLYPHIEKPEADFLLVYGKPGISTSGYGPYAALDEERYILKREK